MSIDRTVMMINPTNLGNGVFGPNNGLNQIIFELPRKPVIGLGKTLRISGNFTLLNGADTASNNANMFYGNAAVPANPPALDFGMDGRTCVHSAIETMSIQNLEGATFSTVKTYNRLCSSILALKTSILDYQNGGVDIDSGGLGKDVSQGLKTDRQFSFSIPIYDGLLLGQPLNMYLLKGLRIVLTLASNNYVVHNNNWRNQASVSAKADGGAYYQISDVLLTMDTQPLPADAQKAVMSPQGQKGVLEYNTYSSFYNVLQSADHNLTMNINTGRTLGIVGNLIPSQWVNNYDFNSQQTVQPLYVTGGRFQYRIQVDEETYYKGGLRLPLDFVVESETSSAEGVASSMKNKTELNAVTNEWSADRFVKSLATELSNPLDGATQSRWDRSARPSLVDEDLRNQWNIGVGYDHITDNGSNFKNNPFAMRLRLTASTGEQILPHSMFLFVKQKNTIIFQNGMVNVIN